MDKKKKIPAIGIDLGTTYSCVGVWLNWRVEIIQNNIGEKKTPSCVAFTDKDILIGSDATNQITSNSHNTIFDVKRLIGRKFTDSIVQENKNQWPFKLEKEENGERPVIVVQFKGQTQRFLPEEITAMVLKQMKQTASDFLGGEAIDAVVTCPTHFNEFQRDATKEAAKIAGINVLRIISESTAAGIAYGIDKKFKNETNVLIFDLGGGSFDVSVLSLEDGLFEVRATNGHTHLGGIDFDNKLVEYCSEEFRRIHNLELKNNAKALTRLRGYCEKAKRALSSSTQTTIDIDALMEGKDLILVLTRAKLEELCMDLFNKCIPPIDKVLQESKFSKSDINDILLVGGSSRIPKVCQMVQEYFNGKELSKSNHPDEAIACGAAIEAAIHLNVDDEIIFKNVVLLDTFPFALGIETADGVKTVVFSGNTTIPTEKSQIITTYSDNQSSLFIQIFEVDSQNTKDNVLAKYYIDAIPPMPKGQPQIEISLNIDLNSKLYVKAFEKSIGKLNITLLK